MSNQQVMDNFLAALKQLNARKQPPTAPNDGMSEPLMGRPALKETEVGLLGLPPPDPGPDWLDVTLALLGSLPKIVPEVESVPPAAAKAPPKAQAKALAAQGRGGDTKIAHVTASNASNWLLANFPNLYLFGALTAAEAYLGSDPRLQIWGNLYADLAQKLAAANERGQYGGVPLAVKTDVVM